MIVIMSPVIEALIALTKSERSLDRNEVLFCQGDPVRSVFLVRQGDVELVRHQANGERTIIQRARQSAILAEASLYTRRYHCEAVAAEPSVLNIVARSDFRRVLREDATIAEHWAAYLAQTVQNARHRSELLAKKTVTARLDAWLDWNGGKLPPKGRWRSVAEEIAVTPEALYRELSTRR